MIEIFKLVEKCKIYKNEGSQGSLRAEHLTKSWPGWLGFAKF